MRQLTADKDVSLVITGGLRVSSDFAKALSLGTDAIAIGTSALIAIGCQQCSELPMHSMIYFMSLKKLFNSQAFNKLKYNYIY